MSMIARARQRAGEIKRQLKGFVLDYAYLMTLGAALVVVAASALYTWQLRQEGQIQAAADAPEISETAEATPSPTATAVPLPTMAPMQIASTVKLGGSTVRPVKGKILRAFDLSEPVLWEALSCLRVHAGLDIAGEPGEDVLLAMDGTVGKSARDELWGWRVSVEQTDGQTAVYAGLAFLTVSEGQHVTRGQTLGQLMDAIPCEAELGAHLHMELTREGEMRDPAEILP